jgi:hypothetical protein
MRDQGRCEDFAFWGGGGGGGGRGWIYRLNYFNSPDFATPARRYHGWRRAKNFENLNSLDRQK